MVVVELEKQKPYTEKLRAYPNQSRGSTIKRM
jgi:hypothetical protein